MVLSDDGKIYNEVNFMRSTTLPNTSPKTEEEYIREIDRMAVEIRAMLDSGRRSIERSNGIAAENERILKELEQELLCGKS
jgi:hypothetical protein